SRRRPCWLPTSPCDWAARSPGTRRRWRCPGAAKRPPSSSGRIGPAGEAAVRQRMEHWQKDRDFAGVRGEAALPRLAEGEREAWRKLWAGVREMLARAPAPGQEKPVPTK